MIGIKLILICLFTVKSLCRNYITLLDDNGQGNLIWPWAAPQGDITLQRIARYIQGYNALMRTKLQEDQTSRETTGIVVSSEEETESEEQSNHYMKGHKNVRPDPEGNDEIDHKTKLRRSDFEKMLRRNTESKNIFITDHDTVSSSVESKKPMGDSHRRNIHRDETKKGHHTYCDTGKNKQVQKGNARIKDTTPNSSENLENQSENQSGNTPCCKKITPSYRNKKMNELMRKSYTKPKDNTPISYETSEKSQYELQSDHTDNIEAKLESHKYNETFEGENPKKLTNENIDITTIIVSRNPSFQVDQQGIKAYETESQEQKQAAMDYSIYPYTVSIQKKGVHYASGALVGKRWVLTTAQEFHNVGEIIRLFRMRLGSIDCKKGGILTPIKSVTVHPKFTPGQPAFDVCILMSPEPIPLSSSIKPIAISRVDNIVKIEDMKIMKFTITYWPRIVLKQGVIPEDAIERKLFNSMRVSTQKLIPTDVCIKKMATVNVTLNNSNMCLKPLKVFHSDCMPDVGAPLISVDGLWGITSGWISPRCPIVPQTVIFTRVSSFALHAWIDATMHDADKQ